MFRKHKGRKGENAANQQFRLRNVFFNSKKKQQQKKVIIWYTSNFSSAGWLKFGTV